MTNLIKFYTGIGSRKTPTPILMIMTQLALKLSKLGYVLRSGGAKGADTAFEKGASKKHIYIASDATQESMQLASKFHGAWHLCNEYIKRLHGRNAFQVLGSDLKTPSKFVVCWTPDGAVCHEDRSISTGGTGTAISIASHYGVKVFNLARPDHLAKIKRFLNK